MKKLLCLLLLFLLPLTACAKGFDVPVLSGQMAAPEDGMEAELRLGPTGQFPAAGIIIDASQPFLFFGQTDCWALVGTGTPDEPGTIGWIPAAAAVMPDEPELDFSDPAPVVTDAETQLSAAPFDASAGSICRIGEGTQLLLLAQFGEYGYVQTELPDGTPVMGFILLSSLL